MREAYLQSLEALGTTVELTLVTEARAHAEETFPVLWAQVEDFEARFSRFRSDSELTRFNQAAGDRVPVSNALRDLLRSARDYALLTEGLFNPFILPKLAQVGYAASMTRPSDTVPDYTSRNVVDAQMLDVEADWARIPPNTALDLGGIGKGYLADLLGRHMPSSVLGYSLSLGGDLLLGGTDATGSAWRVDIQAAADRTKDSAIYQCSTTPVGVATSGVVREKGGKTQEHQIHPAGQGHDPLPFALCSVAAASATTADVFASSILLGGASYAERMVDTGVLSAVLLQPRIGQPVVFGQGFTLVY